MPWIARLAVHAVALAGLAAVAAAFGRWLRDPAFGGSLVAVLLLAALCALALRRLYGPGGLFALSREETARAPARGSAPPPEPAPPPLWAADDRVDLNTASEAELRTLPGVGPVLAARIAAARPFASVDALAAVPGFSAARLRAIADRVRV